MLQSLRKYFSQTHPIRLMYHKLWAIVAACIYRFPAKKLTVIGVTGTDGKTTTSTMLHTIFNEAGLKTGLASSTTFAIGKEQTKNTTHKTTLGRFGLQKLLRKMVNSNCSHVIIETSSHAIKQQRIWGIPFTTSTITNITPEHLDYHPNYIDYRDTKISLLQTSKNAVINADDTENITAIENRVQKQCVTYFGIQAKKDSLHYSNASYVTAENITLSTSQSTFTVKVHSKTEPQETFDITLPLPGSFNVLNALNAIAIALQHNISHTYIQKGLSLVNLVPGRMEKIPSNKPFEVFIDYAMTEEGYKKLLEYFQKVTKNNIWIIFGCCGDRDKEKRSKIGYVAMNMAHKVIITDDEPYTENPENIRNMIEEGVIRANGEKNKNYWIIPERKKAFQYAIQNAKPGDCIVVPGMGDLDSITVGNTHIPWSDREELHRQLTINI